MQKKHITEILRTSRSVFTFKEIMLFSGETDANLIKRRISYYLKTGYFYHVRRGIYAKDENYNKYELATKIFIPSYISFETVLADAGIIFQYYKQITVASYLTRDVNCDNQVYAYKKLKRTILINTNGIENKATYSVATPERAFLDVLYLNRGYYFDNLTPLNWEKVFAILPLYRNKRMVKKVNEQYELNTTE
jgi:hypothetical protein